jgi:hypothetical protein
VAHTTVWSKPNCNQNLDPGLRLPLKPCETLARVDKRAKSIGVAFDRPVLNSVESGTSHKASQPSARSDFDQRGQPGTEHLLPSASRHKWIFKAVTSLPLFNSAVSRISRALRRAESRPQKLSFLLPPSTSRSLAFTPLRSRSAPHTCQPTP